VTEKAITPMRSFVAAPMRYGSLFLAGDAATSSRRPVPRGSTWRGADVTVLAEALSNASSGGRDRH
jgi:p-hydroxybenzoate 3-monooxygenase